jgi:hypothetical protein
VMVRFGQCLQVFFNFVALMPRWMLYGGSAVGSLLTVPRGGVPGDGEGDCEGVLCVGEGAILDCVSPISSKDLGANLGTYL